MSLKDNTRKFFVVLIHVFLPLFVGGSLYLIFRSSQLRMFEWVNYLGLNQQVFYLRDSLIPFADVLPGWIYFSLPDGLWTYSFTSAIVLLWKSNERQLKFWVALPILISVIPELLQGINLFPGTFDLLDLILIGFAFEISYFQLFLINQPHENKNL